MLYINHNCQNLSPEESTRDIEQLISQGDAIYDYERVPAEWSGFDDQPAIYQDGDAASQSNLDNKGSDVSKLAS
ncbi:MAG: hypothetical protein GC179_06695 [Anaerolineaceae bacterium]|nr:hypothetical protein [Anaerolineaceae bacterium]